jgi:hypothetical protein
MSYVQSTAVLVGLLRRTSPIGLGATKENPLNPVLDENTASRESTRGITLRSRATVTRVVQIVLDAIVTLGAFAIAIFFAVWLFSVTLPPPIVVILSIFATLAIIAVTPGLVVLYVSPPRIPLRERSALVASATGFIRSAWSAVVFALAIVIGSVAGALASKSLETTPDLSTGVQQAWNGLFATASVLVGEISLFALFALTVGLAIIVVVDVPHLFS